MLNNRVPIVLQMEAAECGAASLCMVLGYYKKYIDLSEMRRACHVSRDGSKLSYIIKAANLYGLDTKALRSDASLKNITLPAIAFWRGYHFIVVEKISEKQVIICDPAKGRVEISRDEFKKSFSGIVLQLTPKDDFVRGGKLYSSSRMFFELLKRERTALVFLGLLAFLLNLVGLIIPGLTSLFVDYYLPSMGMSSVTSFFGTYFILIVVQGIISYFRMNIIIKYERHESASINSEVIKKLLKLPMYFFETRSHTTLVSRLKTIDNLSEFLASKIVPVSMGLIFSILYFCLLFYYSPIIGAIVGTVIFVLMLVLFALISSSKSIMLRTTNEMLSFYSGTIQNFKLFDTIKASSMENKAITNSLRTYVEYQNSRQKFNEAMSRVLAIPASIPLFIQTITVVVGCCLTIKKQMTLGTVLACQSIAMSIFMPLADLINKYSEFQSMDSNLRGLHDIQQEELDIIATRDNPVKEQIIQGKIEFRQVSFGYNTALPPIVNDITFLIEPGKSLALVGGSGSGKTTILKLLEGLYLPQEGEILYDDVAIMETNKESLSKAISIVSQKPYLFSGTVRDNITLFDQSISIERIEEATKMACIYEDIQCKAEGFNEIIEPTNCEFSGGQIQRIMIARALVKNPTILIMDEATSALDPIVEEKVMNNIKKKNISTIIVAHRLSTIRDCDEIAVLNNGIIQERGRHEELMKPEYELYRKLVLSEGE